MQSKFSVQKSFSDKMISYFACSVFLALMLVPTFLFESLLSAKILACVLSVFLLICLFMTVMKKVTVDGSRIKVRTSMGRIYSFGCAEILDIECGQSTNIKQGCPYYIAVKADRNNLVVDSKSENFDLFAEYLLEKVRNGEINNLESPEQSRRELTRLLGKLRKQ